MSVPASSEERVRSWLCTAHISFLSPFTLDLYVWLFKQNNTVLLITALFEKLSLLIMQQIV